MAESMHRIELRSTISADGLFELSLEQNEVRAPSAGEVTVRIEAAPINPADLLVMFGSVDVSSLVAAGSEERPVVRGIVPHSGLEALPIASASLWRSATKVQGSSSRQGAG